MTSKIFDEQGRIIGRVEDGVFVKTIVGSKHLLRKPPAIATDRSALLRAKAAGALHMQVTDRETNKVFTTPLDVIFTSGFTIDRSFGVQIALPLPFWTVSS